MSRYPTMPARGQAPEMRVAYDENLLSLAPNVTREDRQQGYDIDILERQPVPVSFGARPQGRARINFDHPSATGAPAGDYDRRSDNNNYAAPLPPLPTFETTPSYESRNLSPPPLIAPYDAAYGRRVPWWRTKKGLIALGVGIVLFIGILTGIIAGVVSQQKKNTASLNDGSSPLNEITASAIRPSTTLGVIPSSTPELDIAPGPNPAPAPVTTTRIQNPISGGGVEEDEEETPRNGNNNNDDDDDDDDDDDEEAVTTTRRSPPRPSVISTSTKPAICASFPNIPACQ